MDYSHLTHIENHAELTLYELIPNVVWIFDIDKHGWWWGNEAAIKFWGLESVEDLINKDLSGDTQGARDRTMQTFDLAAKQGLTIDPWTTYPNGKPKTLHMMHRAVTLGPEHHRGIIAYINEEVNMGEQPENLLLVEAMRYTQVLVTSFTQSGAVVIENPAATAAYKAIHENQLPEGLSEFAARFVDPAVGAQCLKQAWEEKGGRWDQTMRTNDGPRRHTLDIRLSRHPLSGDFLLLVTEYDVTPQHEALAEAEKAKEELRRMAHYDALTGLESLHLVKERFQELLIQSQAAGEKMAVMFVDLDGFKGVNDAYGHDAGDSLLVAVAGRLKGCLREGGSLARIGGDEFIIIHPQVTAKHEAAVLAHSVVESVAEPFEADFGSVTIGASVGIALYPDHGQDLEALLKAADDAMYVVKKSGKGDFRLAD